MKERILHLLEELVGAHNFAQKKAKADEIAAHLETAFPEPAAAPESRSDAILD